MILSSEMQFVEEASIFFKFNGIYFHIFGTIMAMEGQTFTFGLYILQKLQKFIEITWK